MQELRTFIEGSPSTAKWMQLLVKKDVELAEHSERVAVYSRETAKEMGLSAAQVKEITLLGLLHDVGKVLLPLKLLRKNGPLSHEERTLMRQHTIFGEQLITQHDELASLADQVRHEHERWDGHGYPDRIKGNKIPLNDRIVAVCDCYDAITSNRPYRQGRPADVAVQEIKENSGTQFDAKVVEVFLRVQPKL